MCLLTRAVYEARTSVCHYTLSRHKKQSHEKKRSESGIRFLIDNVYTLSM